MDNEKLNKNIKHQDILVQNNKNKDDYHDEVKYFDDIGPNKNEFIFSFFDEQLVNLSLDIYNLKIWKKIL